jgi:hypothetical protein
VEVRAAQGHSGRGFSCGRDLSCALAALMRGIRRPADQSRQNRHCWKELTARKILSEG